MEQVGVRAVGESIEPLPKPGDEHAGLPLRGGKARRGAHGAHQRPAECLQGALPGQGQRQRGQEVGVEPCAIGLERRPDDQAAGPFPVETDQLMIEAGPAARLRAGAQRGRDQGEAAPSADPGQRNEPAPVGGLLQVVDQRRTFRREGGELGQIHGGAAADSSEPGDAVDRDDRKTGGQPGKSMVHHRCVDDRQLSARRQRARPGTGAELGSGWQQQGRCLHAATVPRPVRTDETAS